MLPSTEILKTIELIRTSFTGAEIVFNQGSCVKLAMILKHIYPEGKILYDLDHAIFEYGDNFFDINGFANKTEKHVPIQDYGILSANTSMNLSFDITIHDWIPVTEKLPEPLETVWMSNGKGWTSLGCRTPSTYLDGQWVWCWAETNGTIYEENGEIITEADEDDLDVQYWHKVPKPINKS